MIKKNNNGFTLLETVIAFAVFSIVIFSSTNLLIYCSKASSQIYASQELLEQARISLDFFITQMRNAEGFYLNNISEYETADGKTLSELYIYSTDSTSKKHTYIFKYNKNLSINNVKYHRLEFGGQNDYSTKIGTNELACYISDVNIKIDSTKKLMYITIETENKLGNDAKEITEPIILKGVVSIKNKKYN